MNGFGCLGLALAVLGCLGAGAPARAEIPEVAVYRLTKTLAGTDLSPERRAQATVDLAEAQLASGDPEAAMETLRTYKGDAPLLRARIAMHRGRWEEALPLLRGVAHGDAMALALGEAECLRHLGRSEEAIARLREAVGSDRDVAVVSMLLAELLLEAGKRAEALAALDEVKPAPGYERAWLAYLHGQAALADGEAETARKFFQSALADRTVVSPDLLAGATLGSAQADVLLGNLDEAVGTLQAFLWQRPGSPRLADVFAALDALYERQDRPSPDPLFKLALEPPTRRAALAAYYLARARVREGNPDMALAVLESFTGQDMDEPIMADALVMLARMLMERGRPAEDVLRRAMLWAKTPEELGRVEMLIGMAQFRNRDFVQAAISFRNAADHAPALEERAIFNAALAWLYQGNHERFLQEYAAMSAQFPESALRQDLILERGLVQARDGDPRAKETLEIFLRDFSGNPRAAEARVALAELAYAEIPADRESAERYLRIVNDAPDDAKSVEQADYLAVYLEGGSEEEEAAIDAAKRFLAKHPKSRLRLKVRMKLGELYFAAGDLANARTIFETVAIDSPNSAYAGAALFLAGQAAAKMMDPDRALELFEAVVKRGGPFALYARAEQAAVKTRLGEESEAIILYDSILGSDPPADLRFAAMIGKGDSQFLLGGGDPAQYEAAVATYHALAALPGVPARWRDQALYKQGKALEKLGRPDAALAAFTEVMEGRAGSDATWVFRAGFDAARILESGARWKSAATIYERMSKLEGPRSGEAKKLLTRLRLEHFLWE